MTIISPIQGYSFEGVRRQDRASLVLVLKKLTRVGGADTGFTTDDSIMILAVAKAIIEAAPR